MFTCSNAVAAGAIAALLVSGNPARSQISASAAPATTSSQTPLPQAPSALINPLISSQDAGISRPPGSGVTFAAPSTILGPGGLAIEKPFDGPLRLSLDDAISLGLQRNLRLRFERANQQAARGYRGQIVNAINPGLQFRAASSIQEINLAALGFNPSALGPALAGLGLPVGNFPSIVKVNTTSVQVSANQRIVDFSAFELLRAIKPEFRAVDLTTARSNGDVVQAVATAYFRVLADETSLANSIQQETSAKVLLDQATARDAAGVGVRLDVLRAQVEYQQRQQQHLSADAQLDKDGIQLNRIMGIPAGQELDLTDDTPFSEIADLDVEQAKQTAYLHRNDLLSLQASIEVAAHELKAIKFQRLPTLAVNGFYGILGLDQGPYHGVFNAAAQLRVPVFREAGQRGEEQTAAAQLQSLREQESSLRGDIDAQVRSNLLDVASTLQLVKVAQSNVDLSQAALSDARDRFSAGVTDNLEEVDALASVTGAQSQLNNALFQYNVAKLSLAHAIGVLQIRYRAFLGM